MQRAAVSIENLSLSFGGTEVLRDVDLAVEPGEFFALLGPSGSGKSTLLRAIAGFSRPQGGRIVIGATDVTRVPPWKRNVGLMFQNYALWPHMTVRENVAFGLEERRLSRRTIREKVEGALNLVGLADLSERRPNQLSGGQQQRVALARTIVIEPQVLLLDEPLSNLDAKLRLHMRQELRALQRNLGITTLFVTHDQEEALAIANRVALLDQGVLQQVGTPVDLYDSPANRFVAGFVGSVNILEGEVVSGPSGEPIFLPAGARDVSIRLPGGEAVRGSATLAFRPNAVKISPALDHPPPGGTAFHAVVTAREFQGETIRYTLRAGEVEILADLPHLVGAPALEENKSVTVSVIPDQIRLLGA
ncbi:MAG: ABC transporter ATP-binding protein [Nitrospirae bacterium]|nr:ABC transporter ATP-binding protein [Nitrospirota bacterium]